MARKRRLAIPPFAAPPSAGGGFTPAGATLTLSQNVSVTSGNTIPFDTVNQDPHGFANLAGNDFVVPAGFAGLYLYGFIVSVSGGGGLTQVNIHGHCSGNADDIFAIYQAPSTGQVSVGVAGLERFAVGDTYHLIGSWTGVASAPVNGGPNSSQMWILRVTT